MLNEIKYRILILFAAAVLLLNVAASGQNESASGQAVQSPADGAIVKEVVSLIEQGQWDQAQQRLSGSDINSNQTLNTLKAIIDQYHLLSSRRVEKQSQVYNEKYAVYAQSAAMIEAADPNASYPSAFSQLRDVWDDATEAQKKELSQTKAYQQLMEYGVQKAKQFSQAAQWSKAWTQGAKWLVMFEPENSEYLQIEDQLRLGDAVQSWLEKDPCRNRQEQYVQIKRAAVYQAFAILSMRYVEVIDFKEMTQAVLKRCEILTTVLKNDSVDFACPAEAAGFELWDQTIAQLVKDSQQGQGPSDLKSFTEFIEAILALNEKTLKLSEGALVAMMTEGAVATLDPYTQIVWPYEIKDFEKDLTGQFGGIGIRIKKENDRLIVTSLIPDTPAMTSGLQPDDIIVAVDGELTEEMSTTCAVQKISGPIGTSVTLSIQRPGQDKEQLISLVRAKVVLPAVEGTQQADNGKSTCGQWDCFLDSDHRIGYLRLNNFTERTVEQLVGALDHLEQKKMGGLILDLRGNGGGLLTAAVDVSDLFISQGRMLSSKGRDDAAKEWEAKPDTHQRNYPIAVMIDQDSASSSEVVAGILGADATDRAILIGSRSYGKGSVQEVVDLGQDIGRLKYTMAYYYLPDGERVKNRYQLERQGRNDWGICPDVNVPLFAFEVTKIDEVNQERRRIMNTESQSQEQASINEQMLEADAQLATAVLVLKAMIAAQ